MNMKKTFIAVPAAFAMCCGIFICTASAQDDDLWGDYSTPAEMSMPDPDPAPGWEPLDEPAPANKPVKAAKTKPEKAPKAAKAPKPAKEAKPKAASVAGDDRTLNIFVNTGWGFGQGGYLVRELNTRTLNNTKYNETKDYYMNLGQGLKFEAGAGYMATPNLEARFSADFNIGLFAPKFEESVVNAMNAVDIEEVAYSYYSWGLRFMAVPQFEVLELFDMYLGAGLSFNFAGGSIDSTFVNVVNQNVVYGMQFGWPVPGFCGLLGFVLPLSDEMDFLSELQFESKSFTLNKLKLLQNTQQTDPGSPEYKENNEAFGNAPKKYSGSNWGLRVGIKYWFAL